MKGKAEVTELYRGFGLFLISFSQKVPDLNLLTLVAFSLLSYIHHKVCTTYCCGRMVSNSHSDIH